MPITVKYLEELGVEKETAEKIFAERSKEIEADKVKREKLEEELKETKNSLETLTTELETVKTNSKSAEEVQAKLDALVAERDAEKKQAEADRILKEKTDKIASRFETVKGEKKFSHSAVEAEYLKKFGEALESKDYEGQSDADIFHALTKDDAAAFTGVQQLKLAGGKEGQGGGTIDLGSLSMADYIAARKQM